MDLTWHYIYALRDPQTQLIRYIGKSDNPHRRWLNHLCEKPRGRSHRRNWVLSLKRQGLEPEIVILEAVRGEWPWEESEKFWIDFARRNDWPLLNVADGGNHIPNATHYSGDDHWTRKKPELLARGERNGAKTRPEATLRGEQCPASRLTEADIRTIRHLSGKGYSRSALALQFRTAHRNISHIVNKQSWKHVN